MNEKEYLMIQAASECMEVAHRITKALHFGLNEIQPGQEMTNDERVVEEYIDLLASMQKLQKLDIFSMPSEIVVNGAIAKKQEKIDKFMGYARDVCGTVEVNVLDTEETVPSLPVSNGRVYFGEKVIWHSDYGNELVLANDYQSCWDNIKNYPHLYSIPD